MGGFGETTMILGAACTVSVTGTVTWFDPMVNCICPLYVPGPSFVLRMDAETVTFCEAPPASFPPVGAALSQFTLLLVDTLVDHIPNVPQLLTAIVWGCGLLIPATPVKFKDCWFVRIQPVCTSNVTFNVSVVALCWLLKVTVAL